MATAIEETERVRTLRQRGLEEKGLFWADDGVLCVFDPQAAQKVNAVNFADLTLPDKLSDVLRGRSGEPFSWKRVRTAWLERIGRLSEPEPVARFAERMETELDRWLGREVDLMWAIQQVATKALVPSVIDGLPPGALRRVHRDLDAKLHRLLISRSEGIGRLRELWLVWVQIAAGNAVRSELRGRRDGRRPRRLDLADPIVDLLPELGIDRAVDAVTMMLTAIGGPPGAAATCLLYELEQKPEWAERLTDELSALSPEELFAAPLRAAPTTRRFVQEILRMWSPPVMMARSVRTEIDLGEARLEPGQRYLLSTFFIHHDPHHWDDPDTFDPDRWLPEARGTKGCPYVPFGWAPKTCVGASLGMIQLELLAWLLLTRYRVRLSDPEAVRMLLEGVPTPLGLEGTITRR